MSVNPDTKKTKFATKKTGIFAVAIFVIGLSAGLWIGHIKDTQYIKQLVNSIKPVRENNFNYHYIFPLLTYDFSQADPFLRNKELDDKIDNFVSSQIQKQNAQNISVYVKNFSDNKWAGTNEDMEYHPGSMLKVLIMMAYFREAELDPSILEKNLLYSKNTAQESASLNFSSPSDLKIGNNYPVKTLIEDMIANSDNGAETLLIDNVNRDILNSAFADLRIPNPDSTAGDYTISSRKYAAFLRILYNSTYLTEAYSEQALSIMAKSTFREGLSAGVPSSVTVAQKYGERVNGSTDNIQSIELHDCGIVYVPDHPYSLCVMTKGKDVQTLTTIIKNISSLVYETLVSK